jgi:hypothetical protein
MLESDCTVPGFELGDIVYIRGRVVALCKTPWGPPDVQIAAQAIDSNGNVLGDHERVYWVDPKQAVNAATVKAEIRR